VGIEAVLSSISELAKMTSLIIGRLDTIDAKLAKLQTINDQHAAELKDAPPPPSPKET
jgi:hypothetical protein